MSAAFALPGYAPRREPALAPSFVLSALVHLLFAAALVLGLQWQNRPPERVVIELWNEPPSLPQAETPTPPAPAPEPAPEPPRPEPVIQKPEIALKEAPKPKPKPVPEPKPPAPKAIAKVTPVPPKPSDEVAQRRLREELVREQASLALERERTQIRDQLARDAAAARDGALASWVDKVRAKIRGNLVLQHEVKGNPEAIFDVVQLPTGEVLSARLRKSSGDRIYDDAVERAILKSSPLPRPERADLFMRSLELKFRPRD